MTGMQYGLGEILAARAAEAASIPYTLSTVAICSIEDVAEATTAPFWFQLYVMKDRGFAHALMERAAEARCSAPVLTVDLQVAGPAPLRREERAVGAAIAQIPQSCQHDAAAALVRKRACRAAGWSFGNLEGYVYGNDRTLMALSHWVNSQFDATLSWKDVEWIRSLWKGPLIIKGILDVDDAKIAAETGANALVVSNHGGRQLDGAPSSIAMLPKIAEAVGGKTRSSISTEASARDRTSCARLHSAPKLA